MLVFSQATVLQNLVCLITTKVKNHVESTPVIKMEFIDPANISSVSRTLVVALGGLFVCSTSTAYFLSTCTPMCAFAQVLSSTLSSLQAAVISFLVMLYIWRKIVTDNYVGGNDVELVDQSGYLKWRGEPRGPWEANDYGEKTSVDTEEMYGRSQREEGLVDEEHPGSEEVVYQRVARKQEMDAEDSESNEEEEEEELHIEEDLDDTSSMTTSSDSDEEDDSEEKTKEEKEGEEEGKDEEATPESMHAKGDSNTPSTSAQDKKENIKGSDDDAKESSDSSSSEASEKSKLDASHASIPVGEHDESLKSHDSISSKGKLTAGRMTPRESTTPSYLERLEAKRNLKYSSGGSYAAKKMIKQQKLLRKEVERQKDLLHKMETSEERKFPDEAVENTKRKIEYLKEQLNQFNSDTVETGDKCKDPEEEISILSTKSFEEENPDKCRSDSPTKSY